MTDLNKVHRPHLPVRKPQIVKGNAAHTIIDFITPTAKKEQSFVILTTEPDLFHVMIQWLNDKNKKFELLKGGYRLREDGTDNKVIEEDSIIVTRDVAIQIWQQGWLDMQESVLHIYHKDILGRYKAELCFINDPYKDVEDLGLLIETTKEKALFNPDGYTHKLSTDNYYITVKHGKV